MSEGTFQSKFQFLDVVIVLYNIHGRVLTVNLLLFTPLSRSSESVSITLSVPVVAFAGFDGET